MRVAALVLLRGLRRRWWVSCGIVVLTLAAVTAGAIGPVYLDSSMTSLRVDRIEAKSGNDKSMSWRFTPGDDSSWERIRADATAAVTGGRVDSDHYAAPQVTWVSSPRITTIDGTGEFEWGFEARTTDCAHLVVTGRCPRRPHEMMVAEVDVERGGFAVGSSVGIGPGDRMEIVGSYRLDEPGSDYWYDPVRYASVARQGSPGRRGYVRYSPAPFLVTPGTVSELPARERFVRVDRAVRIPPDLDQGALDGLADTAAAESRRDGVVVDGGTLAAATETELDAIRDEVEDETQVAQRTILPASLSLIIVCVVLLFRLVAAASRMRRAELALLEVRGWTGWRLRAVTLAEPLSLLAVGWVAGVVLVVPVGRALSGMWLRAETPTTFSFTAAAMSAVVLGVAVAAVLAATRGVASESLWRQLEATSAPAAASRALQLLRVLLVGLAGVAVIVAVLADESSTPGFVAQAMPALVGIATAIVATELIRHGAARLVGPTARRASTVPYLHVRGIARRVEGTLLVLPVTVALTVSVFTIGVWSTAEQWRASASAAEVGAERSYEAAMSPIAARTLTHELDPEGRWLMTAAYTSVGQTRVLVDTPRLEQVAEWPDSWTGDNSLTDVAERLDPVDVPEIRGRELSLTVESRLRSDERLYITITLLTAGGDVRTASLGPYPDGRHVRHASVEGCDRGCEVVSVRVGGVAGILSPMAGRVTLGTVRVDGTQERLFGRNVDWEPGPDLTGDPEIELTSRTAGARIVVDSRGSPTSLLFLPRGMPVEVPVIAGRDADLIDESGGEAPVTGSEAQPQLRSVATAEAVPVVGSVGVMADLTTVARATSDLQMRGGVRILATDDTPTTVVQALHDAGVRTGDPQLLSEVRAEYDGEAYALVLRLYVVAAVGTLALTLIGVIVSLAVQVRSRRRDAAALRITGVDERRIWLAGVLEICSVIAVAVTLGAVAGGVAAKVVVGNSRLGTVHPGTPRILGDLDVGALVLLCGGVLAVLVVVAALVSRAAIRSGRPSTLRGDA